MTLKRLAISRFRNISTIDLALQPGSNLFCGANGSGKTSLLEAVYMLASGRSFRSRQHQAVIQHNMEKLTVFAQTDTGFALGVEKSRNGKSRARINQEAVDSSSQLASCLPLQIINSDSFAALDGGPGVRRQLLDWVVFHVEHSFAHCWKNYQIALRQRNALLRRGKITPDLLQVWEAALVEAGEQVHQFRLRVFSHLKTHFLSFLKDLSVQPYASIGVSYRSGWKKDICFIEALNESREGDCAQGYTRVGAHRADLRFTVSSQDAALMLSRGQQKMVVCALRMAMAQCVMELCNTVGAGENKVGNKPVFLVDDLPSELDLHNQCQFTHWISRCSDQVLVTGIDAKATLAPWIELSEPWSQPKMFHVEHGQIHIQTK